MNPFSYIISFDYWSIASIGDFHKEWLNEVMIFFSRIGDSGAIWIALTLCILLFRSTRIYGYFLALWLLINAVLGEIILKHMVDRPRPFVTFPEIDLLIVSPVTSSFPSWHTSSSWCFAILFTYFFWKKSKISIFIIWMVAIFISFSRFYLQVHYPSDIFAWVILGVVSASLALYGFERYTKHK